MVQNISHAVMAQRQKTVDELDDFPTPPWATRALLGYVLREFKLNKQTCLEPACNVGYMSKVLSETFKIVTSSDIFDYGYGKVEDFLKRNENQSRFDWVITNPPFNKAKEFIEKSLLITDIGVAILARTTFLESINRYETLFKKNPPTYFAQFVERVPMVKGRLDKKASTATGYAWFVWVKSYSEKSQLIWIPPCRKLLEREEDYDNPLTKKNIVSQPLLPLSNLHD
jgi:hypothetical protein